MLGEGGMGVVYEAYDRERRSLVALKTLRSLEPDALLRFKSEFRRLSNLVHPNLVAFGELVDHDGQPFFTMELIRGTEFLRYVRPGPADAPAAEGTAAVELPEDLQSTQSSLFAVMGDGDHSASAPLPCRPLRAARFDELRLRNSLTQLASGLEALHQSGMVHRDIKPSNLLITDSGRLVILDFGLVTDAGTDRITDQDQVVGTVTYMAPEQMRSAAVDAAADCYSLGVILYIALTGERPFSGNLYQILRSKERELPALPSSYVDGVPSDLETLCMALLSSTPAQRPTASDVLASATRHQPAPTVNATTSIGFVGRIDELRLVREALMTSRSQPCGCVFAGVSGIGKSALLQQVGERARELDGAVVLHGRCYQRESMPYKGLDELVDELAAYLRELEPAEIDRLIPNDAGLLPRVFSVLRRIPALRASESVQPLGGAGHELRSAAFAAMRELLRRLADGRPLVLIIDDVQWSDADSLALLSELLKAPEAPAALLVLALRTDADSPTLTLETLQRALPIELHRIDLDNLSLADAHALTQRLISEHGGRIDAAAIAVESAGHPLFIDSLVRYRIAQPDEERPVKLEEALWWRIQRLDAAARELLELVCVAGRPVERATAARATSPDPAQLDRLCGLLASAHLMRQGGAGDSGLLEPFHDRVRAAVVHHLSETQRAHWHGRLALALESTGSVDVERLGDHWRAAGEARRAGEYFERAAIEAKDALAFDRAARLFAACLELASNITSERERELRIAMGDALVAAGRGYAGAEQYLRAASGASPAMGLELRRRAAEHQIRSGHIDAGMRDLDAVLREVGLTLPQTPRQALAHLLWRRLRLKVRGLRYRLRSSDDLTPRQRTRIDACWSAAASLALVDPLRGVLFQSHNLALALQCGEPYRVARALAVEACFVSNAGPKKRNRCRELCEQSRALANSIEDPHALAWARTAEGAVAYLFGDWRAAVEICRDGEERMRRVAGGTTWEINTLQLFGLASSLITGDLQTLYELLPVRLREAEDRGDLWAAFNLRTGHVNAAWLARGDVARARRLAGEAASNLSTRGFFVHHYYDLLAHTQIALYEGDVAAARQLVLAHWPAFTGSMLTRVHQVRAFAWHLRARTAVAAAAYASAAEQPPLLREARQIAKRLRREGAAWCTALALAIEAGATTVSGPAEAARAALATAQHALEAADMQLHAAALRHLASAHYDGEVGTRLGADTHEWFAERSVPEPAKLAFMLVPGARQR